MSGSPRVLVVETGTQRCTLPLEAVVEVCRPQPVERLEGAPRGVLGVSRLRGEPLPVVDLGAVVRGDVAVAPRRWVHLDLGGRAAAVAVDGVIGLRAIPPEAERALPPLFGDLASGPIAALARLDRELVAVLAASRLLPGDDASEDEETEAPDVR